MNQLNSVKILLDSKCQIDVLDNDGQTPLTLALELRYEKIIPLLLTSQLHESLNSAQAAVSQDLRKMVITWSEQCKNLTSVSEAAKFDTKLPKIVGKTHNRIKRRETCPVIMCA